MDDKIAYYSERAKIQRREIATLAHQLEEASHLGHASAAALQGIAIAIVHEAKLLVETEESLARCLRPTPFSLTAARHKKELEGN